MEQKTGARALRGVVSKIMSPIIFDLGQHKNSTIVIDDKVVRGEKPVGMAA